jgi:Putative Ig domain
MRDAAGTGFLCSPGVYSLMRGLVFVRRRRLPAVILAAVFSLAGFGATAQAADLPPKISGAPATFVYVGSNYSFRPTASDPERKTLRFTIANKPSWASFSTTSGQLSGTPLAVGYWTNIQIKVSDGVNTTALPAFALRASSRSNVAPTISGTPPTSVVVGSAYSFVPTAKDSNGDPLRFSVTSKPSWASFSATTGQLSGTPTTAQVGTYSNIVITTTDGSRTASLPAFSIKVTAPASANGAPTISGTPAASVTVGQAYSFRPTASDPDGNTLGFTIQNRPAWATFSTATGQLSGTPTSASLGSYSNIIITTSDGRASATLPAFAIGVDDVAGLIGGVSLSWTPPTQNTDGSALGNLAGYRINYGRSSTELVHAIQVANPGITRHVIEDLAPGTYYFVVRAFTSNGTESANSSIATKTVL